MVQTYGQLIKKARIQHDPPLSAKELADALEVKPPFITDIEKGRRLPSLETQKRIKQLLVNDEYHATQFDDLAAADNCDKRIVAEDLSHALRKAPDLRELVRAINAHDLTAKQIRELINDINTRYCACSDK